MISISKNLFSSENKGARAGCTPLWIHAWWMASATHWYGCALVVFDNVYIFCYHRVTCL